MFVDKPVAVKVTQEEDEDLPMGRDRKSKYNMDNVRVDVKGLMRPQSKRVPSGRLTDPSPSRRESDHSHAGGLSVSIIHDLLSQPSPYPDEMFKT